MFLFLVLIRKGDDFLNQFMDRYGHLVHLLFSKKEGVTLHEISAQLEVAASTAVRDIQTLEKKLPEHWKILRNEKGGIRLFVPEDSKIEDAWKTINDSNDQLQLLKTIIETENCTNEYLRTIFNFSRATLYRKVVEIKKWLDQYDIELITQPNFQFKGDERNIRAMMVQFYDILLHHELESITAFPVSQFQKDLEALTFDKNIYMNNGEIRRLTILLHVIHIRFGYERFVSYNENDLNDNESIFFDVTNQLYKYFPKWPNRDSMRSEYMFFSLNLQAGVRAKNQSEEIWMLRKGEASSARVAWIFQLVDRLSEHFYIHLADDDNLLSSLNKFSSAVQSDELLYTNTRHSYYLQYEKLIDNHPLYLLIKDTLKEINLITNPKRRELFLNIDALQLFFLVFASLKRFKSKVTLKAVLATKSFVEHAYLHELLSYKYPNSLEVRYIDHLHAPLMKHFPEFDVLFSTDYIDSNTVSHVPVHIISSVPTRHDKHRIEKILDELIMKKLSDNIYLIKDFEDVFNY